MVERIVVPFAGEGAGSGALIDALTERLSTNPQQFPIVFTKVRRALLRRFPYALFFAAAGDALFVIACFHASRDPLQWQKRTSL